MSGWLVAYLKVKVSLTLSMMESRVLVKLGRLSGEDLDIYSWWGSLDEKLAVSERMNLVVDMATYAKNSMRTSILGIPFTFFPFI